MTYILTNDQKNILKTEYARANEFFKKMKSKINLSNHNHGSASLKTRFKNYLNEWVFGFLGESKNQGLKQQDSLCIKLDYTEVMSFNAKDALGRELYTGDVVVEKDCVLNPRFWQGAWVIVCHTDTKEFDFEFLQVPLSQREKDICVPELNNLYLIGNIVDHPNLLDFPLCHPNEIWMETCLKLKEAK